MENGVYLRENLFLLIFRKHIAIHIAIQRYSIWSIIWTISTTWPRGKAVSKYYEGWQWIARCTSTCSISLPYSQHIPVWFFCRQQLMSYNIWKSTDLRTNIKYAHMNKTLNIMHYFMYHACNTYIYTQMIRLWKALIMVSLNDLMWTTLFYGPWSKKKFWKNTNLSCSTI